MTEILKGAKFEDCLFTGCFSLPTCTPKTICSVSCNQ